MPKLTLHPVSARDRSKPAGYQRRNIGHYTKAGKKLRGGVCSKCHERKCCECHSLACRCRRCHRGIA